LAIVCIAFLEVTELEAQEITDIIVAPAETDYKGFNSPGNETGPIHAIKLDANMEGTWSVAGHRFRSTRGRWRIMVCSPWQSLLIIQVLLSPILSMDGWGRIDTVSLPMSSSTLWVHVVESEE
jgi:hypothetical protein